MLAADVERKRKEDEENATFLRSIHSLAESGQVRSAAARIMEYTDALLLSGRFDACERLLDSVDVARLATRPTLLVAFLGITLGARDKLGEFRGKLYVSAKVELSRELGPDRAERILRRFQ